LFRIWPLLIGLHSTTRHFTAMPTVTSWLFSTRKQKKLYHLGASKSAGLIQIWIAMIYYLILSYIKAQRFLLKVSSKV